MNRWALVNAGVVVNSIIADPDMADVFRADYDDVIETTDMDPWPSVDWTWDGSEFTPPADMMDAD